MTIQLNIAPEIYVFNDISDYRELHAKEPATHREYGMHTKTFSPKLARPRPAPAAACQPAAAAFAASLSRIASTRSAAVGPAAGGGLSARSRASAQSS